MSDTLEDIDTSQLDNVGRVKVDTPSNVTILDMTEDCTRLVFDRLTLNQLIHLRAVCHAWNHIITIICENKPNLTISFSKYAVAHCLASITNLNIENQFQLNSQNLLLVSAKIKGPNSQKALKRTGDGSFSEQQNDPNLGIRFIARLFPNITNFVCCINYQRMFELNYILWKWSTNLDTLTIISNDLNCNRISRNALQDFVKCFGLMRSLRRFHMLENPSCFHLPVIATFGQLEEFTFDNYQIKFAPYFAQLDANRCTVLRVESHSDMSKSSSNPLEANPELTSKLTHLSTSFIDSESTNHVSLHCAEFKNLIKLEINYYFLTEIYSVFKEILTLQKLKILVLKISQFVGYNRTLYKNNPNYRSTFPIFHNTINELHLTDNDFSSDFPEFQEYNLFARTFPMVSKICIYSNNLKVATFDAQYRPRFSEAFDERVEVTFSRTIKLNPKSFFNG